MTVAIVLEQRFTRTPDGAVWTPAAFARPFWDRYLDAFTRVVVVARVEPSDTAGACRVDGGPVTVHDVPHFIGPGAFLRRAVSVRRAVAGAMRAADAVVLRTPGTLANLALGPARAAGRPVQIEVVGDPLDVFAPGVVPHPGRALFRAWYTRALRRQAYEATVAAYVTERALQRRYPPGPATWATSYSDVELPPEAFVSAVPAQRDSAPFRLVTVVSLDQPYKSLDVQLAALARLRSRVDVTLDVVGEGRLRPGYQRVADQLGVESAVTFHGALPGPAAVREVLDAADVFWLPSRTEGLPRSLIEAMARGLPAVATPVGGIPELLPTTHLVPVGDAEALATHTTTLLADPAVRASAAAINLRRAADFADGVLAMRRAEAYRRLAAAAH